jgi:hypothetical protein
MSEPDLLPPDLAELERRLSHRPLTEPSAALRSRVVAAVRREMRRASWTSAWQFAAAMLLVGMIGGNLILATAGSAADGLGRCPTDGSDVGATALRLRAMLPEIPREDAFRFAWLLESGAGRKPLVLTPRRAVPQRLDGWLGPSPKPPL